MHITIENARMTIERDVRWWNLYLTIEPDGGEPYNWTHKLPEETFEWRVAEYGFDPVDQDTLLEVVLYEPYLDQQALDPTLNHVAAPSRAAARDHLLEHVRRRKGPGRLRGRRGVTPDLNALPHPVVVDSAAEDPTETIKREMVLSPEHVAVKREYVELNRASHHLAEQERRRKATTEPSWARPTPDEERKRLMPKRGRA